MKKSTLWKSALVLVHLLSSNYFTNGLVNDYRYNILWFSIFQLLFAVAFVYFTNRSSNRRPKLDITLLFIPVLITCITAIINSWNLFFPEFLIVFIFSSILIFSIYFFEKRFKYMIALTLVLSYFAGNNLVNPYFYKKLKDVSNSKEKVNIQNLQLYDLNDSLISIRVADRKITLLIFGTIDCLPCRQLDKVLLEDIIEPNKLNNEISILKINPTDKSERIRSFYDPQILNHLFKDKFKEISKMFDIQGYPVCIVLNSKGDILKRYDGYKPEFRKKYISEINEIIKQQIQ